MYLHCPNIYFNNRNFRALVHPEVPSAIGKRINTSFEKIKSHYPISWYVLIPFVIVFIISVLYVWVI